MDVHFLNPIQCLSLASIRHRYPNKHISQIKFSPSLGTITICLIIERNSQSCIKQLVQTIYHGIPEIRDYLIQYGSDQVRAEIEAKDPQTDDVDNSISLDIEPIVKVEPVEMEAPTSPTPVLALPPKRPYVPFTIQKFPRAPPTKTGLPPLHPIKEEVPQTLPWPGHTAAFHLTKEEEAAKIETALWKTLAAKTDKINNRIIQELKDQYHSNKITYEQQQTLLKKHLLVVGNAAYDAAHGTDTERTVQKTQMCENFQIADTQKRKAREIDDEEEEFRTRKNAHNHLTYLMEQRYTTS